MKAFQDKTALITGAGSGIGKALAFHLAENGANVVLTGRRIDKLQEVEKKLHAKGCHQVALAPGDVSVYEDCEQAVAAAIAAFGQLDILVNNAGLAMEGELEHTPPQVFKALAEVNYLGSLYQAKAALPWLKQSQGSICFVSSVAARYGMAKYSGYSASKMALTALSQALRLELYGTGVHVGIIYVGFVENEQDKTQYTVSGRLEPMTARQLSQHSTTKAVAQRIGKVIAQRRKTYNYSFLGRLLAAVQAISPALVHFILARAYHKSRTGTSG
jgi:NADP-dependent 3-hydroxy acid dehydrogenase YdfG